MPRPATRRIQIEVPINLTITLEDDRAGREHAYFAMLADIAESAERIGTQYYLRPERGEAITACFPDACDVLELDAQGSPQGEATEGRDGVHGPPGQAARRPEGARPRRPGARLGARAGRVPGRTGQGAGKSADTGADPARPRLFLVRDDAEKGAEMGDHARGVDRRPAPKPRHPRGKSA